MIYALFALIPFLAYVAGCASAEIFTHLRQRRQERRYEAMLAHEYADRYERYSWHV